jgi:protein-disulfide isomerase
MKTLVALAFTAIALSSTSAPAQAQAFSASQEEEIRRIVGEWVRKNPEIILQEVTRHAQEMRAAEQRRTDEAVLAAAGDLVSAPHGIVVGNPEAKKTIVYFFDSQCGFCKQMEPVLKQVLKEKNDVRIIVRDLPILGPASETAALISQAVHKTSPRSWEGFHTKVMEHKGTLDEANLKRMAEESGAKWDAVTEAARSEDVRRAVAENRALALRIGVQGTPFFFVNPAVMRGAVDLATLLKAADEFRPVN